MSERTAYRIELEQFSGPMDLLLHLLREEELEVAEIPVARICDRYLEHLKDLDRIDIDAAGDFLVMASTLMRMKSQSVLPTDLQDFDDDDELDPRFELVRQLIQYRRFKHVAELLAERREEARRRFARGMHPELDTPLRREPAAVRVDDGGVELLFTAFARLLRETRASGDYVVSFDDTPMQVHLDRLKSQLPTGSRVSFRDLVPRGSTRGFVIGVFLALLELLKVGAVDVFQEGEFGHIVVEGRERAPAQPGAAEGGV